MTEPSAIIVRDAVDADRAAALALTLAANEQYAAVLSPAWWEMYRRNIAGALGDSGAAECIVAERAGMIVGSVLLYARLKRFSGWPEIRLLAVAPEARGRGVGTLLMEECLRRTRLRGVSVLGLHTMEVMVVGRRLYERMGFVRAPQHDFQDPGGWLVMGYRFDLTPDAAG